MLKRINNIIKIGIFVASFVLAGGAFAQSPTVPTSNLSINPVSKTLEGTINQTIANGEIDFVLKTDSGTGEVLEILPWQAGSFSISLNAFEINPPIISGSVNNYTKLVVEGDLNDFTYNLDSLIQSVGPSVEVNFPGWENLPDDQILQPIPNSGGKYYPVLKSNFTVDGSLTTTRTPADADLYLVIANTNSNLPDAERYGLLKTFPGGSSSFNINFPNCSGNSCQLPISARLDPGETYAVFLSDDYNSQTNFGTAVDYGNSGTTYLQLPTIPDSNAPSGSSAVVSNISATPKKQGDKRYYEITGTINRSEADAFINFVVKSPGVGSGENIAQVPYQQGPFTIPTATELNNSGSFAPGPYELHINSTTSNNASIQPFIVLPEMVSNPVGTNTVVSSDQNIIIYNSTQEDILDKGIVPKCGYNLSGEGKTCGFDDLITLVQRAIEYIFILVVPVVAIVFAYAGYLYLTSGGNSGKRENAKNAMLKSLIGIVVVMSAWLIVTLIVKTLGATDGVTRFLDI